MKTKTKHTETTAAKIIDAAMPTAQRLERARATLEAASAANVAAIGAQDETRIAFEEDPSDHNLDAHVSTERAAVGARILAAKAAREFDVLERQLAAEQRAAAIAELEALASKTKYTEAVLPLRKAAEKRIAEALLAIEREHAALCELDEKIYSTQVSVKAKASALGLAYRDFLEVGGPDSEMNGPAPFVRHDVARGSIGAAMRSLSGAIPQDFVMVLRAELGV